MTLRCTAISSRTSSGSAEIEVIVQSPDLTILYQCNRNLGPATTKLCGKPAEVAWHIGKAWKYGHRHRQTDRQTVTILRTRTDRSHYGHTCSRLPRSCAPRAVLAVTSCLYRRRASGSALPLAVHRPMSYASKNDFDWVSLKQCANHGFMYKKYSCECVLKCTCCELVSLGHHHRNASHPHSSSRGAKQLAEIGREVHGAEIVREKFHLSTRYSQKKSATEEMTHHRQHFPNKKEISLIAEINNCAVWRYQQLRALQCRRFTLNRNGDKFQ